jgi:hypothetical protein
MWSREKWPQRVRPQVEDSAVPVTATAGFPLADDVLLRLSLQRQAEESTKLTASLSTN